MNFDLNIKDKYFNLIKNGSKTIELRLYDEKRKVINKKDKLIFLNETTRETMDCVVINMHISNNFFELIKIINIEKTGFKTMEELNLALLEFYSAEKQEKYGVVGIEIEVI